MKDKLKVKVWNYKNVVLFEVLEQDESLREKNNLFEASNGWKIIGKKSPEIDLGYNELYIRGCDKEDDYIVLSHTLTTKEAAKKLVEEIKQAVKEFNESQREILDKEEKEYLSAVIKPYRNRVKFIEKRNVCMIYELIHIEFDLDFTNLPVFKENLMYKNMKPNKRYTLEELGL